MVYALLTLWLCAAYIKVRLIVWKYRNLLHSEVWDIVSSVLMVIQLYCFTYNKVLTELDAVMEQKETLQLILKLRPQLLTKFAQPNVSKLAPGRLVFSYCVSGFASEQASAS